MIFQSLRLEKFYAGNSEIRPKNYKFKLLGACVDLGLKNKRALVTGGTRGIGAAIVETLALEGARVVTCARSADAVRECQAYYDKKSLSVSVSTCDVRDPEANQTWIENSITDLGGVDIFVANVSGGAAQGEEGWKSAFEVDLMATVRGCDAVLPTMAQGGNGSIVIISSIAGVEAFGGAGPYGTIKAGLISYASQLADAAGEHGIRVNCVSPGPIHVEDGFWGRIKKEQPEFYEGVCARHPSGRMGTPNEVARAAAFLVSDAASWITGSNLIVDGGMTKRVQF
jgi:NAD(P)-dependent dehydrogenase (short-subunit alcohol dehydrogenase family)